MRRLASSRNTMDTRPPHRSCPRLQRIRKGTLKLWCSLKTQSPASHPASIQFNPTLKSNHSLENDKISSLRHPRLVLLTLTQRKGPSHTMQNPITQTTHRSA